MDKENCLEEFYLLILQWLVMAYNFLVASGKSYYLGNVTRFQLLEKNVKEKKKKGKPNIFKFTSTQRPELEILN